MASFRRRAKGANPESRRTFRASVWIPDRAPRVRNDTVRLGDALPENLGGGSDGGGLIRIFELVGRQQHDIAVLAGAGELGRRTGRDARDEKILGIVHRICAERTEGL